MKIIINKTGKTEEVSLRVAQRLFNKGKAHPVKNLEEFTAELKTSEVISEPLEEIKVELGEVGILEELIKKPKRSRKKKSKLGNWND